MVAVMRDRSTIIDTRLYMTAKAVCAFVARTFQVTYTTHALAKPLKRPGFVYKLPKCVPAKANEDIQPTFVATVLGPLMAEAKDDTPCISPTGHILRTPTTPRMAGSARVRHEN
jgi:hypothetical protein